MASFVHLIDQRRLIGPGGSTVSGEIYFYYTGTTIKAPIYSDAALLIPAANPVVVGAGQVIPLIFLDDTIEYRRVIVYSDGSEDQQDPLGNVFSEGELGLPVGAVIDHAGPTAPDGFVFCYGQELSRTAYSELFDVISTQYGSGNGTTTFNVPDYRGRVGAGKDNMGGSVASRLTLSVSGSVLGAVGGNETHVLTVGELPSHDHTASVTDPGHTHSLPVYSNDDSGNFIEDATSAETSRTVNSGSSTTGVTVDIGTTGSDDPHNNVQPTIVVNKIIKTRATSFLSMLGVDLAAEAASAVESIEEAGAIQIALAEAEAASAAQSAAYAGGFETPEYASQSAGNAATTQGQIFRVPLGTSPQTFNWYRRLSVGSELVSPLATTSLLASTTSGGGADLIANVARVYNVKSYGAAGDGSADDTAEIQAAIAAVPSGGIVWFPEGTYMTDYITIAKKVHIKLSEGATIKNRVPASPATTLNAHWGIFRFVAGSGGSTIEGGTLDGNRAALAPYYIGHTRLGQDNHWWGIRTEYVDDITIINVKFRNFMSEGFYTIGGNRFRALDFDVADCGVAFAVQGENTYSQGTVIRGRGRNIGNVISGTAYYLFQHGVTFGTQTGFVYEFALDDFCASKEGTDGVSTGGGKEPVPIGMNFYLLEGGSINASIRDYTTVSGLQSIHQGFNFSSVNNCSGRLSSYGFEQALAMSSSCGNQLDVDFDGEYVQVAGFSREGLLLTHGGVSTPNAATLAGEAGSNLISRDNVLRGTVNRFGIGVRDEGEGNDLGGLSVYGNVTDGVQLVVAAGTSASYPVSRRRLSGGRDLVGIQSTTNGNAGVIYTGGSGDRIIAGYIRDNGQTFGSPPQPYNLAVVAGSGEGVGLQICDNDLDFTPSVTLTNECSFVPGTATAKSALRTYSSGTALTHTYQFVMRNVNAYRVGEIIRLKGVVSGADADGKVVDIDQDVVTIAFASALTFTATLDNLTGTGSTSGTTLTGSGTAFASEVDFPAYLKKGSEYRRIVYVNSNTSAVIDSAFTTNMSGGSTLQVVRADVVTGIIPPVSGLNVNGNVTAGPMLLRNNVAVNVDNTINYLSFPGIAAGSHFDVTYSLIMAGTGLDNTIVTGLPKWTQVRATVLTNVTAITGTSGTNTLVVKRSGSTISTPIASAPTTINSVTPGAIPDCPAFQSVGGSVNFVSATGNPIGTVRVRLSLEKLAIG